MVMNQQFSERLLERTGGLTVSYWDFIQTIGDFIEVDGNNRVLENHPRTKIAKEMIDFLKTSGVASRKFFENNNPS